MTTNPNESAGASPSGDEPPSYDRWAEVDAAFDFWLQRGLRELFGTVAAEPVPDDLLRLVRDYRAEPRASWDGPTYRHRGARIECRPGGQVCRLILPGHPLDGVALGPAGAVTALVDLWLDERRLPDDAQVAPSGAKARSSSDKAPPGPLDASDGIGPPKP